jgi:hypothetical protein
MTQHLDESRMDRLATRLAAAIGDAVTGVESVRRSRNLTDDEAAMALDRLLESRGIRLNDGLLRSLAATHGR